MSEVTKQEVIEKYIHPKLQKYVKDIKYGVIGFFDCIVVNTDFGIIEENFDLNTIRTFRNINNRINQERKLTLKPTERMIVLKALGKK